MKCVVLRSTGLEEIVNISKGKVGLEELQQIVGGYIEIVNCQNDQVMILNEEGKLEGLPKNHKATSLYNNPNDFIVGDVVLAKLEDFIKWDNMFGD